ncbi:ubiquinone biosynthesis monooxygenase COQ6, mitochondrial-like isoform X2 [Prorops nasuta]|uniref:ubiquinone biosynthesis monooxygenase COQ6, mitochondrial-like isoform X2 n=1 Tax=Prorops nasuta TaxID=863751 RepID=UPI0034CEA8D7
MTGVISAISSCRSVISASGILHCIKCTMNRKINTVSIENNKYYDMIIVGGGMVGSALACAAANNRRLESTNILLLEGSSDNKYTLPHNYSNRVVALNQQTRILLSSIGAWQHIEASRYCPVHKMQ